MKAVHVPRQVLCAARVAEQGGGCLDGDTAVSPESFTVALAAAGACASAVDAVMQGKGRNALCLVRPPGHHATPTTSMGFCLFNNIALAAQRTRTAHGLTRILIVDWDVHHGNGTQDIFYADPGVQFFSIHRYGRLLSRHRRRRRDGDRHRPRPHAQRADALRHFAPGLPRRLHGRAGEGGRRDQAGAGAASAPASTPTPPTRSARSAWRSRISRR